MAPKINPNPQLKKETNNVGKTTKTVALDVLVTHPVIRRINCSMGLLRTKTWPNTKMSIIW